MGLCTECRSFLDPGKSFCRRCGAWTASDTGTIGSVSKNKTKTLDQVEAVSLERIVTGDLWDQAWGGGIVPSSTTLMGGPAGCLAGDTVVHYVRGERWSAREITLRDLYLKFNGYNGHGRGQAQRWTDLTMPTYLRSLWPDGRISPNRIMGVLESGVKPTVKIEFESKLHLVLTEDHPIAVPGGGFVEAGSLNAGDYAVAQGSLRPTSNNKQRTYSPRIIVNTKYHPIGAYKAVEYNGVTYEYMRVSRARLVYEAAMNDLSYEEFVHALRHNEGTSKRFKYLPKNIDVHHIDENSLNDDHTNLMALPHREHARLHGDEHEKHFKKDFTRNVRIEHVSGSDEVMTYDVQMEPPAHNFVANGIVVHNCGKSSLLLRIASKIADITGKRAYYLSAEQAAGELKLMTDRMQIQNTERIRVLSEFGTGADVEEELLKEDPPAMFVVDSVSALCGKDKEAALVIAKKYKALSTKYKAPSFLISHMTKDADYAGLMSLQHEVDTLITIGREGNSERKLGKMLEERFGRNWMDHPDAENLLGDLRVLTAWKNRYGPTGVDFYLSMTSHGLVALPPAPVKGRVHDVGASEMPAARLPSSPPPAAPDAIEAHGQKLVRKVRRPKTTREAAVEGEALKRPRAPMPKSETKASRVVPARAKRAEKKERQTRSKSKSTKGERRATG